MESGREKERDEWGKSNALFSMFEGKFNVTMTERVSYPRPRETERNSFSGDKTRRSTFQDDDGDDDNDNDDDDDEDSNDDNDDEDDVDDEDNNDDDDDDDDDFCDDDAKNNEN